MTIYLLYAVCLLAGVFASVWGAALLVRLMNQQKKHNKRLSSGIVEEEDDNETIEPEIRVGVETPKKPEKNSVTTKRYGLMKIVAYRKGKPVVQRYDGCYFCRTWKTLARI